MPKSNFERSVRNTSRKFNDVCLLRAGWYVYGDDVSVTQSRTVNHGNDATE